MITIFRLTVDYFVNEFDDLAGCRGAGGHYIMTYVIFNIILICQVAGSRSGGVWPVPAKVKSPLDYFFHFIEN